MTMLKQVPNASRGALGIFQVGESDGGITGGH
jgi:hypothetical protein